MAQRLGNFVIFMILTVLTCFMYPIYFSIAYTKERNELLEKILVEVSKNKG
ncbi:hypothetical protein N9R43_01435 [bacterium]|nr:hypothetical protein [bacterium]